MKIDNTDLGTITELGALVSRCVLPTAAGMDALEARLITVQEVPSRAELRFFAVRGGVRDLLSSNVSLATLRDHVPRKSLGEMDQIELVVELSILRVEADRMRPVYEAAKEYRRSQARGQPDAVVIAARRRLTEAIDAAIATEDP
jgi:hypothetical protein